MVEFKAATTGETEAQWRQFLSYLFAGGIPGIATTGILAGLSVSQTTPASTGVLVASGAAVVQDTVTNGVSPLISNAAKTPDILVANPVGAVPRNDIVVFDSVTASIRSLTGVPNVAPGDPTVPATAVPLARLRHAANATTVPAAVIDQWGLTGAGVRGDSGRILGVYAGAFDPSLPPSGIPQSTNKVWGNTPQNIGWCDIPDQGRPYRVMLNCFAEIGAESTGSRYDFYAFVTGSGQSFGAIITISGSINWRQLVSWPSAVVSGAQRVNLQAVRVLGAGVGAITPYNQAFVVTVYAA